MRSLDPDPEGLQGIDHVLADFLGQVRRVVEVAGLVVGQRLDRPVVATPEQEELELGAGVHDITQLLGVLHLAPQDSPRIANERLAAGREDVADHARRAARAVTLLPGNFSERAHVGHEVLV